ncbi:hypothetical protein K488DRAFT_44541, partial [Vararia minispora EC-137]
LNFLTVPLIATLFLLAVGAIDGIVIRKGIVGADGVSPLDILALFLSLAYISISLDATGLLRFLAFWVAKKGGTSGKRLYFFFYVFFLFCGIIVGNDPVILSGTAFLVYFTRISGITPPTAWIFAQFCAANMASAVLVSSNPTNLVLSGSFSLSFITYTSSLVLPSLAASIAVYPIFLFLLFRHPNDLIPRTIDASSDAEGLADPRAALVDSNGAIFGGLLLLVTLGVLVGTSVVGVPVWEVTVPPALIMLARDAWHDWRIGPALPASSLSCSPSPVPTSSLAELLSWHYFHFKTAFPTVHIVVQRLPFPLVPFSLLMFVLVQGLAAQGWVDLFVIWWDAWVRATGLGGAVAGMAFISGLLCNVCGTNIGTTILLARTLQLWEQSSPAPAGRYTYGARCALALGSNFGAFTLAFAASLAGLLWREILRQKGIHVERAEFARLNMGIWVVATAVGVGVLIAQSVVVYPAR